MRLIDIDTHEGIALSKEAERYIRAEYPPDDYDEMYDVDGDICVDEVDYNAIWWDLQRKQLLQ